LPEITDPNVLVGTKTADDAAVYRVSDELALIKTGDFFTPVVDDPYLFGAIAAADSLSDVYAMGGRPTLALNIVGFLRKSEAAPMSILAEILRGGAEKARELAAKGLIPGGTRRNKAALDADVRYGEGVSETDQLLLCDAQTSRGVLLAVDPTKAEDLFSALSTAGVAAAAIGEFVSESEGKIEVLT